MKEFRSFLRESYHLDNDVLFVPYSGSSDLISEFNVWDSPKTRPHSMSFIERKPNADQIRSMDYDKSEYDFSQDFIDNCIRNGNKAYFFLKTFCRASNTIVDIGQILEFNIMNGDEVLHMKPFREYKMLTASGEKISVYHECPSPKVDNYERFVRWENLLWMKNYRGPASENKTRDKFALVDQYMEPLVPGDVVLINGFEEMRIGVIKSIDLFCIELNIIDLFYGASTKEDYIPDHWDQLFDNSGKTAYSCKLIKAPDHIKSKVLEWKLTNGTG